MTGVIVHEWVSRHGGSEGVFKELAETYPDAALATLWMDDKGRFPRRAVTESWLSRTPLRHHKSLALPFMIPTWRSFGRRRPAPDWILASSHAFAHHVGAAVPRPSVPKFVYAHTPARYIWSPDLDERGRNVFVRLAGRPLQRIDRRAAQEPVAISANSAYVQERIAKYWGRDSEVIHPPVNLEPGLSGQDWSARLEAHEAEFYQSLPEAFLLGFSRFVSYKRLDVAIDAAVAAGIPLVLAGAGPDEARLRAAAAAAGIDVRFIIRPSDALLFAMYASATALVFPGVEDFGIVPVEAMSFGTPVIANRVGGARETVVPGRSGVLVDPEDKSSLADAVTTVMSLDRALVQASVVRYGPERFRDEVRSWMRGAGADV